MGNRLYRRDRWDKVSIDNFISVTLNNSVTNQLGQRDKIHTNVLIKTGT
jgi:hypothetical protein